MDSPALRLEELEAAYQRISKAIYRALEDAYDFSAADIITALERDHAILDASFFVLIFGQLERRINDLARRAFARPMTWQELRGIKFERRLSKAIPGEQHSALRTEILEWYELRSGTAHGERIATKFNIRLVLNRAQELDALLHPR